MPFLISTLEKLGFKKVPTLPLMVHRKSDYVYQIKQAHIESICVLMKVHRYEYLTIFLNRKSWGIHRLKCMAFLPLPDRNKTFKDYIINHKDGNKLNNDIDNLEWSDYKGNLIHAFKTGLRTDNHPLWLYDLKENKYYHFYSKTECAKFIGCGVVSVIYNLSTKGKSLINLRYQVGYTKDIFGYITKDNAYKFATKNKPVKLYDSNENLISSFSSLKAMHKYIGMKPRSVPIRKQKGNRFKLGDKYVWEYVTKYDEMLEIIDKCPYKRKYHPGIGFKVFVHEIIVTYPDKTVKIFPDLHAASRALGASHAALQKRLSKYKGVWREYKLEYGKVYEKCPTRVKVLDSLPIELLENAQKPSTEVIQEIE